MRTGVAWIAAGVCVASLSVSAQHARVHRCVVIDDGAGERRLIGTVDECRTRLSPASTYKIPHALIGLETGVVTADTIERWDGVRHPRQRKWDQDHTVLSAMRPSVLWFFQRMAPKIGAARARDWLTRFDYGNADSSGPIAQYWINGRLRISPDEQLAFVKKFYAGTLPVSRTHMDAVRDALEQTPGTVENSLGVHRLDAAWRAGLRLNSKTGKTTIGSGQSISWLVGQLTIDDRRIPFAAAVWRDNGDVDTLDAARLAIRTFVEHRFLERR